MAIRLWMRAPDDPLLALMWLISAYFVHRCLSHIPRQISRLSDSSVVFEDVFGIEFRLPFQVCEHHEIFRGLLAHYFNERFASQRVIIIRYSLVLGNARGVLVDPSSWNAIVKPRTHLIMVLVLHNLSAPGCAECSGELGKLDSCSNSHPWVG